MQSAQLLQHLNMSTAAAVTGKVVNPYQKSAQNAVDMGRQSQQRVSNQHKQKFKLCSNNSNNKKRKKGDQLTLDNRVAFQPEHDCKVCKAKETKNFFQSVQFPNEHIILFVV